MSGQGQTLPAAKAPAFITCLTWCLLPSEEARHAFKRPRFQGKLLSKWVSFGNDLMNRRLTGQPLKISFVRH